MSLAYCAYWITFFPSGVDMRLISRWPVDLTDCRWITFTLGTFFFSVNQNPNQKYFIDPQGEIGILQNPFPELEK